MIGIYSVKIGNKMYIGSSNNIESRIANHKMMLLENRHTNTEMQNSYNKSHEVDFDIIKTLITEKYLESWENYFIGYYDSLEGGFNKIIAIRKNIIISPSLCEKYVNEENYPLMIPDEVCKMLRINKEELDILTENDFPCIKISVRTKRFEKDEVIKWLRENSK